MASLTLAQILDRLSSWKQRMVLGGWWTEKDDETYHDIVVILSKEER